MIDLTPLQKLPKNVRDLIVKKCANLGLFFVYFRLFKTNIAILTTNKCEKMSRIWRWDWNSQPSDYKSPPLTARPGLPL